MLDILGGLRGLLRIHATDGIVFWLHSRATSAVLVSSCMVLGARQLVGSPLECIHTRDVPAAVLEAWCWVHSTYSLPSALKSRVGQEVSYPGVGPSGGGASLERRVHRFYQWVPFCLFSQVPSIHISYTFYIFLGSAKNHCQSHAFVTSTFSHLFN